MPTVLSSYALEAMFVTSPAMCMSVCVCLSVCEDISGNTRDLHQIFVHVAYVRGLVVLRYIYDRPHCLSAGRGCRECTARVKHMRSTIACLSYATCSNCNVITSHRKWKQASKFSVYPINTVGICKCSASLFIHLALFHNNHCCLLYGF